MTDHRPRILCLHGGGTNATIFQYQARNLISKLKPHFRLVYANAPFLCDAGPNVLPLYRDHGPFRCWLPWKKALASAAADDNEPDKKAVIAAIEESLERAMRADDTGTGPWIGLMGFSQGAKLSASLLLEQELRRDQRRQSPPLSSSSPPLSCYQDWEFAVLLHGIAPLVGLSEQGEAQEGMQRADQILGLFSEGFQFQEGKVSRPITVPTIHVHGVRDMGLQLSRKLRDVYCENGFATLIEWDGDHRIPVKTVDVQRIVNEVFRIGGLT